MLLNEEEAITRLSSPLNLINRLRAVTAPVAIPSLPPKAEDLIPDLESKIAASRNSTKAAEILSETLDELRVRLPEVIKPEKLASIANDMNRIIHSEAERNKNSNVVQTQVIVYAPQVIQESEFETIDVLEAQ